MAKSAYSRRNAKLRALLREARLTAGVSQVDLAERLHRPQSFVSKFEKGERRLDVIEFLEIADALKVDPFKLLRDMQQF